MKKTMFRWLIALAILLPCTLLTALAAERTVTAFGTCGEAGNGTWTLYEDGELVISGNGEVLGAYAWDDYVQKVSKVTIEDGITDLYSYALDGFENAVDIFIGSGMDDDYWWWELGSSSVASFTVDEDNEYFSSQNGVLFSKDKTTLLRYPTDGGRAFYKIPDAVKSIYYGAFAWCDKLQYFVIPASVELSDHLLSGMDAEVDAEWGEETDWVSPGVTEVELVGLSSIDPWNGMLLENVRIHYQGEYYSHYYSYYSVEDYRYGTYAGGTLYGSGMDIPWEKEQTGKGTVTCRRDYGSDIATITAVPADGYELVEILVDGVPLEGNTFTMTGCNTITVTFEETVPTVKHTAVVDPAVAATCTSTGLTEGSHCSVCGEVLLAQTEIPALGHDYIDHAGKTPTTESVGWEAYQTCSRCDYTTYKELAPIRIVTASGYCGSTNDGTNIVWTLYEDGELMIAGTGAMANYSNTTMPWCDMRSSIKKVVVGEGVTTIGSNAFYNCDNLTSVMMGENVTTIEKHAFNDCDSLTAVNIGESVVAIGEFAFAYCDRLTSATIPDGVATIGNKAFYYCKTLSTVTISGSVTTIGDAAFRYCYALTKVEFLGDAPAAVGANAFESKTVVRYHEGTDGWTDGTYYDGEAGTWCGCQMVIVRKAVLGHFSLEVVATITVDGQPVDICRWIWTPME